jgi:hypothetical protein
MSGRQRWLVFDFANPFTTMMNWIEGFFIFGAVVVILLVLGAIVAIPLGLKLLGVAFAKTIVIETSKVVRDLGIANIDIKQTKEIQNLKNYYARTVTPILSRVSDKKIS